MSRLSTTMYIHELNLLNKGLGFPSRLNTHCLKILLNSSNKMCYLDGHNTKLF